MTKYRATRAQELAPREQVGLKLETEVVVKLDQLAKRNHRSRAGEVSALIDAAYRREGLDVGVLGE